MRKIRLYDKEFLHLPNYCGYDRSDKLEWVRYGDDAMLSVFTERCLDQIKESSSRIKIAWLLEPWAIHHYGYDFVIGGHANQFNYYLSFDERIHKAFPDKTLFWTPGGSWVWKVDWSIYPKTKNLSIVAGMKDWTDGHRLRHQVIKELGDKFDIVAGYGRNTIEPKMAIFKDYRFSVVIENSKVNWYWTDKLIDCFACGTVPIFWGCPDIGKYFNTAGIISFDTVEELGNIIERVRRDGEEIYAKASFAINDNFERAKKFNPVEDHIHETLKIIEGVNG